MDVTRWILGVLGPSLEIEKENCELEKWEYNTTLRFERKSCIATIALHGS